MTELVIGTFARRGERSAFDRSHPLNLPWQAFTDEVAAGHPSPKLLQLPPVGAGLLGEGVQHLEDVGELLRVVVVGRNPSTSSQSLSHSRAAIQGS